MQPVRNEISSLVSPAKTRDGVSGDPSILKAFRLTALHHLKC